MEASSGPPFDIPETCPYFGTKRDPETQVMFPSRQGTCYATPGALGVSTEYQSQFCLSPQHTTCKIYTAAQDPTLEPPLPPPPSQRPRWLALLALILLLLILIAVALFIWPGII